MQEHDEGDADQLRQAVAAGQTVLTIEAMKMESELVAPNAGTVRQIEVSNGDIVDAGAPLVIFG